MVATKHISFIWTGTVSLSQEMIQEMLASASFGTRRAVPSAALYWECAMQLVPGSRSIDDIALAVAEKVLSTGPAAQLLEDRQNCRGLEPVFPKCTHVGSTWE